MSSTFVTHSLVAAATLGLLAVAGNAEAAILAQYQFPGGAATPTTTGAGVTAGNFIPNSNPVQESTTTDTSFSATSFFAFIRSIATGSTSANALADDDYFSVTMSATNPGEYLDLTSLTLTLGANKNSGQPAFTSQLYLQTSVGGFGTGNPTISGTNTSVTLPLTTTTTGSVSTTFDLSGVAFDNLSTITFQFRVSDDANINSTLTRLDDVTLNGDVVVPEPMSLSLLGVGGLLVGRRRRA